MEYNLETLRRLRNHIHQDAPGVDRADSLSAVMILFDLLSAARPAVILTKRTDKVESHKSQISFPGGFHQTSDTTTLETAFREFEEEMGAHRSAIEVLGRLGPVVTHQGVAIIPWVGIIAQPIDFSPNQEEVARVIFLPVSRLMSEGLNPVTVRLAHTHVSSTGIIIDGELVWGATAAILAQLKEALTATNRRG